MSLIGKVKVNDRFQRAIRIDSDLGNAEIVDSFICPQSSVEVLLNMARGKAEVNESAFTWTGPYGSGKSSLVVILNALLGQDNRLKNKVSKIVGAADALTIQKAFNVNQTKGWRFVPIVGSKRNFSDELIKALYSTYGNKRKFTADDLLESISAVVKAEPVGLFIVVDEMGKFLEAAADGQNDVYFFQQLAELSARSSGKLVILGILHQAFTEYGRKLTRAARDEWSKIQGRFVDLPLNVAGEELIDIISKAIKSSDKPSRISKLARIVSSNIANRKPVHQEKLAISLNACWPLHPVTASLLGPISRRRFGQNQRSVFGFLNSAEPFGFQSFLKEQSSDKNLYAPARLWDYLRANLEPSIMASPDGHKWSIAVDAIYRAEAGNKNEYVSDLLKTIAILDMFQERSGLVPDTEILSVCLSGIAEYDRTKILEKLEAQSLIRFKKHKKAYSLWEGSDFDIDSSIQNADASTQQLDFEKMRSAARFQPIVAKKHYHETGALRWLDVDLVSSGQAIKIAQGYEPQNGSTGLVLVVLGEDGVALDELDKIAKRASGVNSNWPVFVSVAQNSWLISTHAKELQALEWIRNNESSLGG
ncbi:MAG: ATP-binding protein, partial [Micavibrio aeruginosavorus]